MPKKNVTIEDLAIMIKHGFDETAISIKKLDIRLTRVEEKLDNIERLILRQHSAEIQELKKRIQRLENLFALK